MEVNQRDQCKHRVEDIHLLMTPVSQTAGQGSDHVQQEQSIEGRRPRISHLADDEPTLFDRNEKNITKNITNLEPRCVPCMRSYSTWGIQNEVLRVWEGNQ